MQQQMFFAHLYAACIMFDIECFVNELSLFVFKFKLNNEININIKQWLIFNVVTVHFYLTF